MKGPAEPRPGTVCYSVLSDAILHFFFKKGKYRYNKTKTKPKNPPPLPLTRKIPDADTTIQTLDDRSHLLGSNGGLHYAKHVTFVTISSLHLPKVPV